MNPNTCLRCMALFFVVAILVQTATARPQWGVPAAASAANALDAQAANSASSAYSRNSYRYQPQWGYPRWGYGYRPGSWWGYRPGK